jgi:mRNA interferase RelE/StbE
VYSIVVSRRAIKDLSDLPNDYSRLVSQHIDRMQENPRSVDAKKLKGDLGFSLRVGMYRILYDIDDKSQRVVVYRVKHRREAYR